MSPGFGKTSPEAKLQTRMLTKSWLGSVSASLGREGNQGTRGPTTFSVYSDPFEGTVVEPNTSLPASPP